MQTHGNLTDSPERERKPGWLSRFCACESLTPKESLAATSELDRWGLGFIEPLEWNHGGSVNCACPKPPDENEADEGSGTGDPSSDPSVEAQSFCPRVRTLEPPVPQ